MNESGSLKLIEAKSEDALKGDNRPKLTFAFWAVLRDCSQSLRQVALGHKAFRLRNRSTWTIQAAIEKQRLNPEASQPAFLIK